MNKTYRIAERNLEGLYHRVSLLNRKCAKLGIPEITLRKTGQIDEEVRKNEITGIVSHVFRFIHVEVSGESPKFNGWNIAAVVEHTDEGNILRKSPDCTVELNQFREGAPKCDHCHCIRNRRDTFIVIHNDGILKQVGSNCIKDFLGHADPHQLAAMAEMMFELSEICGNAEDDMGCERIDGQGDSWIAVDGFLKFAACATRRLGFVSGKRAHEDTTGQTQSTGQSAMAWMFPPRNAKLGVNYFLPEDLDKMRAEQAKQYVLDTLGSKDPGALTDFEHNLLLICKCTSVEARNAGLLAFVPEYFARSVEDARAAAEEKHFGEIGKRVRNVRLTYLKSTGFDTQYGTMFVHSFSAGPGVKVIWKSSTGIDGNPSMEITATFTVKAHGEFRGHKQTQVSRMVWEPVMQPT